MINVSSWDNLIPSKMPACDITIEAVWLINSYTISFTDGQGNVIQSSQIEYGQLPEFDSQEPTLENDLLDFKFIGWDYEITNVVEDFTYNARFSLVSPKDKLLTQFEIPECVSEIEDNAFSNCTNLTSVIIPNSVTKIGNGAFSYCSSLTKVVLSNSISKINSAIFFYCTSLKDIVIPNSVTEIGEQSFYLCTSLTSIMIPEGVVEIGYSAFSRCGLTSITIPKSVTTIGGNAFAYDTFNEIKVSASVEYIGYGFVQRDVGDPVAIYVESFSQCNNYAEYWNLHYYYTTGYGVGQGTYWHYVTIDPKLYTP